MLSRPSKNPHRYDNKTTVGKAFHKMSVMTNAIYLSREALLKKRDSNKAGSRLTFNFKELCRVTSWKQFISSHSAPMTVLIIILFMIMSTIGCYESYQWILRRNWQAQNEDPMELYKPINYDRKLMMEVEQVLVKAMQLDHKGSVKEYSVFLESTMEKYCMKSLEERGYTMDAFGNENFHLNLRGAIHFVGSGVEYLCPLCLFPIHIGFIYFWCFIIIILSTKYRDISKRTKCWQSHQVDHSLIRWIKI